MVAYLYFSLPLFLQSEDLWIFYRKITIFMTKIRIRTGFTFLQPSYIVTMQTRKSSAVQQFSGKLFLHENISYCILQLQKCRASKIREMPYIDNIIHFYATHVHLI